MSTKWPVLCAFIVTLGSSARAMDLDELKSIGSPSGCQWVDDPLVGQEQLLCWEPRNQPCDAEFDSEDGDGAITFYCDGGDCWRRQFDGDIEIGWYGGDRDAIALAIDCAPLGSTIHFPAGVYDLSGGLVVGDDVSKYDRPLVTLRGDGWKLHANDDFDGAWGPPGGEVVGTIFAVDGDDIGLEVLTSITIRDAAFMGDGDGSAPAIVFGDSTDYVSHGLLQNVAIVNVATGLELRHAYHSSFVDLFIAGTIKGVYFNPLAFTDSHINANHFENLNVHHSETAVLMESGGTTTFDSGLIENDGDGFVLDGASGAITIRGFHFEALTGYSIYAKANANAYRSPNSLRIADNAVAGCAVSGAESYCGDIKLDDGDRPIIENNRTPFKIDVTANVGYALKLNNASTGDSLAGSNADLRMTAEASSNLLKLTNVPLLATNGFWFGNTDNTTGIRLRTGAGVSNVMWASGNDIKLGGDFTYWHLHDTLVLYEGLIFSDNRGSFSPSNIRGQFSACGGTTTYTHTFGTAESSSAFYVVATISGKDAGAATKSVAVVSKATTGIGFELDAAPGTSKCVSVDWMMMR